MGCKAIESAKAMSLAFVLLDFSMRVSEEERSVRDGVYRHVAVDGVIRTRTIYSAEIYTINFIFDMLRNGKPVQFIFPAEGC